MEPTKAELEAEADRIASGTYYGGPNHEEPFDGDQAAEEADYSANAYYDSISEADAAEFNRNEAEINAEMDAQDAPRPYREPGCTCTDYQLEQVGCDCDRTGIFKPPPLEDDFPF